MRKSFELVKVFFYLLSVNYFSSSYDGFSDDLKEGKKKIISLFIRKVFL